MIGASGARWLALAVLVPAFVVVGCGEDVVASAFDEAALPAGASASGSRAAQALAPCPSRMPRDGEACATSGLVCEYGDALDPSCSPVAECDGRAWWRREPACTARCPSSRKAITPGAPCDPRGAAEDAGAAPDPDAPELLCSFAGELCGCTRAAGDPPGNGFAWRCIPADPGCPEERPRIGSACNSLKTCDYGACAFEGGVSLTCTVLEEVGSYSSVRRTVWLVREPSCTPSGRTP